MLRENKHDVRSCVLVRGCFLLPSETLDEFRYTKLASRGGFELFPFGSVSWS